MKIKELNLQAFGKFKNKKIEFKNGINIVFGENESGKSTLFKFIEGIFYGFAKNVNRRMNTEDFEKYKPWTGNEYKGTITFEFKDEFRIMRNFSSNELSFYNLTIGENLENIKELNLYSKIKQPGAYIFKTDSEVFKNTFFIGQLNSKLSSNVDGLKYAIENFTTSAGKYSVVDAISILEKKKEELGRESKKTSPIGEMISSINKLTERKNELRRQIGNHEERILEFLDLKSSLEQQKNFLKLLKMSKEQEEYEKVKDILDKNKKFEFISEAEQDDLESIFTKIESIKNQIANLKQEDKKEIKNKELERDYEEFKIKYARLVELNKNNFSKEIELLNHDLIITKSEVSSLKSKILGSIILALIVVLIIIYFKLYPLIVVAGIVLFFGYLKINPYRLKISAIDRIEERIKEYATTSQNKTAEKKEMDDYFNHLEEKYEVYSIEEIRAKLETEIKKIERLNLESDVKNKIYFDRKSTLEKELENLNLKLIELEKKYNLSKGEIQDKFLASDFKKQKEELISNKNLVEHILKGRNLEDLNHGVEIVKADIDEEERALDYLEKKFFNMSGEFYSNEEKFHLINELSEEIDSKKEELNKLEKKKYAIEKAIEALKSIYLENKSVYLPKIVSFMSDFICSVTSGKYKNLTISENFEIVVEDTQTQEMVGIDRLSNGTVDQLYLGLRLSICDILYPQMPIILDDHFIQYDDKRLQEVIKYFDKNLRERQIIIFSAMKREQQMCESLGIEYNRVNL